MKNEKECKIIQELLPMYIDNLTSKEVTEYIEDHLAQCNCCKEKLKNMNSTISLEKIEQKEIDYLKKIKRKNFYKILMVIIFFLILISVSFWFFMNYRITKNPEGKYMLEKATINQDDIINYDIMILTGQKENITATWYVILTAKEQTCVNIIQELDGYDQTYLEEQYNMLKENWQLLRNPKLQNNKLYMNANEWNGRTKEDLENLFKERYQLINKQMI